MLKQLLTKAASETLSATGSSEWPFASTSDHRQLCLPGKIVHVIHSRPKKRTKLVTCFFLCLIDSGQEAIFVVYSAVVTQHKYVI